MEGVHQIFTGRDRLSLSFYLSARLYDRPLARFQDFLPSKRNEETDSHGPIKRGPFFRQTVVGHQFRL
jgi:hypothetical protein